MAAGRTDAGPQRGDPDALRTPRGLGLPPELERHGFNVASALAAARYDARVPEAWRTGALLPGARSALVLGCGGRRFGDAFAGAPEAREPGHALDRFTQRVVTDAAAALRAAGWESRPLFYWQRQGGAFADFVALGSACGLGAHGRLGVLLHPLYGPWLSLRAVLLTERDFPDLGGRDEFDPCRGCPAPCATACPASAPRAGGFDLASCAGVTREREGCRVRCDARRACVVGRGHAYGEALERRYRAAAVAALEAAPTG